MFFEFTRARPARRQGAGVRARTWRRTAGTAATELRDGGHLGVSRNRTIRYSFSISDLLTTKYLGEL